MAEKESFESQKIASLAKDGEQDITSQEDIETLQSTEALIENTTPTQDQDIQPEQEKNNEIVKDSESNLIVVEDVTENEPENIVDIEITENVAPAVTVYELPDNTQNIEISENVAISHPNITFYMLNTIYIT